MDTSSKLSPELVAFINQHIHSIRQLEMLLLFHSDVQKGWSASSMAQAISGNLSATSQWIKAYVDEGLIEPIQSQNGIYRCCSKNSEMLTLLSKEYRSRPLKIIDVIMNKPTHKMMGFMEAFKLKKEDPNDG